VNQKTRGYRELSQAELSEIGRIKNMGEMVHALVESIAAHPDADPRWVAIARTDLQKGFMSLTRSVAKPESF